MVVDSIKFVCLMNNLDSKKEIIEKLYFYGYHYDLCVTAWSVSSVIDSFMNNHSDWNKTTNQNKLKCSSFHSRFLSISLNVINESKGYTKYHAQSH